MFTQVDKVLIEEKNTVAIYGTLYWREHKYFLLTPHPILKDNWMDDNMFCFHVLTEFGRETHVIIRGGFMISYGNAGEVKDIDSSVFPVMD